MTGVVNRNAGDAGDDASTCTPVKKNRSPGRFRAVKETPGNDAQHLPTEARLYREARDDEGSAGGPNEGGSVGEGERTAARDALEALDDAMVDWVLAAHDWTSRNVMRFLRETGAQGPIAYDTATVVARAQKLTGNAIRAQSNKLAEGAVAPRNPTSPSRYVGVTRGGAPATRLARAPQAQVTSTMLSGARLVGKLLISSVVSALWGIVEAIWEKQRIDAAVDRATTALADRMIAALDEARATRDGHLQDWRTDREMIKASIASATNPAMLAEIVGWCGGEVGRCRAESAEMGKDWSLFRSLRDAWVLQTAGDEEDHGKDVNPGKYGRARADSTAETGRAVEPGDNWARRDLFVHQTDYEWGKLGLGRAQQVQALRALEARHTGTPEALADAATGLKRFDQVSAPVAMLTYLAERGEVPAPGVLRIPQTKDGAPQVDERGEQLHDETTTMEPLANGSPRARRILRAVMANKVTVDCDLAVTSADGAVFVKGYDYRMRMTEPNGGQEHITFTESPD